MREKLLNPLTMLFCGLILGVFSRVFDIYTEHLGKIFSQMAVWILLGTLISIYSRTAVKAMLNVLPFCLGMLVTYYATAIITHGVYNRNFIIGWTIFDLCSPVLAYFAWRSKEHGIFPVVLRIGIVVISVLSSVILFDRLRIYDIVIDGFLIYFLFFTKIRRIE